MAKKADDKKRVIVVGAGGAGALIARELSTKLNPASHSLTLVSPRPFYLHIPATLRAFVDDTYDYEHNLFFPFDKLFVNSNGTFVQGSVTSIEPKEAGGGTIVLDSGDKLEYDVLVLATGSILEGDLTCPTTKAECEARVQSWREKFKAAKRYAIVGGGAVGIELAGELKDKYPDKPVTLVHGDRLLLNPAYPDKYRIELANRLRARGVEVVLSDRIENVPAPEALSESATVTTESGKSISADLVFATRGTKPNTAFLHKLGSDTLTSEGFVRIKPTMQLQAHPTIFAAGDIIDWKEQKQVGKYRTHAAVVADNVVAVVSGAEPKKLYKGFYEIALLSIGKNNGACYIGILWGLVFGSWLTVTVKSRNLWVDFTRGQLGLPK